MSRPTFDEDVEFMRRHAAIDVIVSPEGARIAVSGRWQGRVMTSAVEPSGRSLGFVNRSFIEAGASATAFDNYGGEDRFWLGPEGGQYGFFFAPGTPFELDSWRVPRALQEGPWSSADPAGGAITFTRAMTLTSRAGSAFEIAVERRVAMIGADDVLARFGAAPPEGATWVAFETVNVITNVGSRAWTRDTGLVSVWTLGQHPASPDTLVIVPLSGGGGPAVNDRYFGRVPADRLVVHEKQGHLLFRADGKYRCKIGVAPARATSVLGSHSPAAQLVTLMHYDKPAGAHEYVNSMWEEQRDPYAGDAVNSYNDGPAPDGAGPSNPSFYELETSSPAGALAPGESLAHTNTTFHLVGPASALDPMLQQTLGIGLRAVKI